MTTTLRGDGLASAVLLGLPVMELLDAHNFAILAAAIVVAFVFIVLAWTVQRAFEAACERDEQLPGDVSG